MLPAYARSSSCMHGYKNSVSLQSSHTRLQRNRLVILKGTDYLINFNSTVTVLQAQSCERTIVMGATKSKQTRAAGVITIQSESVNSTPIVTGMLSVLFIDCVKHRLQ